MKNAIHLKSLFVPVALIFGLAATNVSNAALVTTDAGYAGPFIDLSGQANGQYNFTFGPVNLPGMIFTRDTTTPSNTGLGGVLGQGSYGLGGNGSYDDNPVYAGTDGNTGWMRFTLTGGPVSSFGAYVNYCPNLSCGGINPVISALDASNNVIESWDLETFAPISTPNAVNAFEFRGIERRTADIYAFQLEGSYILATGTPNGNPLPPVPEPETYAMMLAGLGLLGFTARRRKQKAA